MTGEEHAPSRFSRRAYQRLAALVVATVVGLAAVAALVDLAWAGGTRPAAFAALAATGLASLLSGVFLAYEGGAPTAMLNRALLAMLTRLALVAGLATAAALSFEPPRRPFLIWLVASYLALLAVDTVFSVRRSQPSGNRL